MQLTARQQEVLQRIQTDPTLTLQEIGNEIGVTRERVRQITVKLHELGAMEDRHALRTKARDEQVVGEKLNREHRKFLWRRMMFVSRRQVHRFMAHIDHHGTVRGYHMPGQETICQYKECTRSVEARGFCRAHYCLLRANGSLWVRRSGRYICKEDRCFYPVYARNLCRNHYNVFRKRYPINSILPNHNKSGYRGVSWNGQWNRWSANIRHEDKQEHLGMFDLKEMAARAYDTAAREYLGEKAKLNFPDENIEVVRQPRMRTKEERSEAARRNPGVQHVGVSGYRGIEWHGNKKRWLVRIWRGNERIYIGRFIDLEEAARAQDSAIRHYLGESAPLNFPDEVPPPLEAYKNKPAERSPTSAHHTRKPGGSSQYRGVSKAKNRWAARIEVKGRSMRLGSFADEEEAARVYDTAAREFFGEFAVLNFPDA